MTPPAARRKKLFLLVPALLTAAAALLGAAEASRYVPQAFEPVTAPTASLEDLAGAAEDHPAFPALTPADRLDLVDLAGGARLEEQRLRLLAASPAVEYDDAASPTTFTPTWRRTVGNHTNPANDDPGASGQNLLFQGLWTDPVTGLSYARARWYDARSMSWLSPDPLGPVDSPNLYAFVGWGPHFGTDPMGECLFGIGGTCREWADTAAAGFEWAKRKVRGNTGGGVLGVTADFLVSTTLDVTETFLVDPLRVGAATGEAVGGDAGALETSLAVVQDVGRAAAVAAGAGATAKAAGRGARALRSATSFDDLTEATSQGLREAGGAVARELDEVAQRVPTVSPAGPVRALEVDLHGNLKAREVVGDSLAHHEIPSNAAVRKAFEDSTGGALTSAQRRALQAENVAVELPQELHALQRTTGGRNTAAQIAEDAANLAAAMRRDLRSLIETGKSYGYTREELASVVRRIRAMNQKRGL